MDCKICQSSTYIEQHPNLHTKYHVCVECGFISKDTADHISLEEEFNVYEMHENSIEDEDYVAFFEDFLQNAVFPYMNDGKQVLDFGSGPEPVLAQLLERDYDFNCTIYDKFYAPSPDYQCKKYDLITTTEVMEHIADPLPIFTKFMNLLVEDGILAVMTLFVPERNDNFFGWHYLRDETHISFFTPQALAIIARKVGLEIIFTDNYRYTTFKKK